VKPFELSFDQIIEEYPQISVNDKKNCLNFAKTIINDEEIKPLVEFGIPP
jgi:uncharacterized protein (DUF433 family)